MPRRPQPRPRAGRHELDGVVAELAEDLDHPGRWLLSVDGVPSSYVDLADPTHLVFEYVRWIGHVLDLEPDGPLDVVHLGGAGCTLPRYLAAARPGSSQVVYEPHADLLDLAREAFGIRSGRGLKLRVGEGRAGLAGLADASADVVVRDAFVGDRVPAHLQTREFLAEVRRVLRPGGRYLANVADRPPLPLARAEVATALAAFADVTVIGEPSTFRGRRFGNLVVVAGDTPPDVGALRRRCGDGGAPGRVMDRDDAVRFASGARPLEDADDATPA